MTAVVTFTELICSDNKHIVGIATLANPGSLNALTFNMLTELKEQLEQWQDDEKLACVVLDGEGSKAFCAGGDVRTMHDVMRDKSKAEAQAFCTTFFSVEYQLDYLIHTYCKPIICWGEGIVMGGGMGLYMGASHRVVTPNSRLAMPEISIGLYPDVGGTWFLNRLSEGLGLFLGLTGVMVNASDAVAFKMADHLLLSEQYSTLIEQLQIAAWHEVEDDDEFVTELLDNLSAESEANKPAHVLLPDLDKIQQACRGDSIEQIVAQIHALNGDEKWLSTAQNNLATGSPISAHLCFRQMTEYKHLSLADCFRVELNASVRCGLLGEFQEGVRARLIEKDGSPKWKFAHVKEVDSDLIDQMFSSLWDEHPLAQLGHY